MVLKGMLVQLNSVSEMKSAGFSLAVVTKVTELNGKLVFRLRSITTRDEMFCFADEVRPIEGKVFEFRPNQFSAVV
jgi:hypothetical protein